MKKTFSILILLLFSVSIKGEIILSEILANEPGGRTYLEWFEIYNPGDSVVNLYNYIVIETGTTLNIPDSCPIQPHEYAVFCRRLVPVDTSDCYEYYWGDSTGVWGDSPDENYDVYQLGMTLGNSEGSIYLLDSDSVGVDDYIWDEPFEDSRSRERDDITDQFSGWHDCNDQALSTPGRENSQALSVGDDYSFTPQPKVISLSDPFRSMTMSYVIPNDSEISLYIYDDSARKRATLMEDVNVAVGQYIWNGTDNNGHNLEPGLYFILLKITGAIQVTKTIPAVIAP